jgi:hypothetical protein
MVASGQFQEPTARQGQNTGYHWTGNCSEGFKLSSKGHKKLSAVQCVEHLGGSSAVLSLKCLKIPDPRHLFIE